tara:strand:- start:2347 stop:3054 length:708 start_codon:yes stop_codon:yes gene_type:complete
MNNFGLLTTLNHPLIDGYLGAIEKLNIRGFIVLLDSKILSKSDKKIINNRIGNWKPSEEYKFSKYEANYKCPYYYLESHNSKETKNLIKANNLQFLVNAGTTRKISLEIIKSLPKGILNVHPGNIPKYRGQDTPEWALLNKDPIEITAHLMGEEYDYGPTVMSKKLDIKGIKTYQEFRRMIYKSIFDITALATKKLQTNDKLNFTFRNEIKADLYKAMPKETFEKFINDNFLTNQ